MDEEQEPLIIDIGSGHLKADTADADQPKQIIPMVIGKPRKDVSLVGMEQKDFFIGEEVLAKKGLNLLDEQYPVKAGKIEDMQGLEKVILYLCDELLQVNMSEHRVLITEPPNNDNQIREELVQMMFEERNVPKLYLGNQAVLSLFAKGLTTGTVIDAGYGKTHTVPIYEGFAIPHATTEVPICGQHLTEYMLDMMQQKGREKGSNHEWSTAEKDAAMTAAQMIKHNHCRVAADYDAELKAANEGSGKSETYLLPDQTQIVLREELIRCPEMLFSPGTQNQQDSKGLPNYCFESIQACENDIRRDLFKYIVLAGGSTMFKNMQERMRKEITALAPSSTVPGVAAPADRKHSQWLGGAILSSISKFNDMWITSKEYAAVGPQIVHRKCF